MNASTKLRPSAGRAVTSCAQDGLWLLDHMAAHSVTWQVCRAYRVSGRFRPDALRAAWRAVLDRHEILRTTLVDVGGRPVPNIAPTELAESFTVVDLSRQAAADRDVQADRLCAKLAADPVGIAEGPAARLTVLRLTPTVHRVVLVLNRTVIDDCSVSILVDELSAYYADAVGAGAGHPVPAELAVGYADYARWQRDQESSPEFRRLLGWWTSALTPLPPPLALPVDRQRSAWPVTRGGELRFDWGEELGGRLAELCRSAGTTPFAVLLATFQTLLHRYSGEDRVAVAVPVAVRPPQFAGLVGPFDNLLVLSCDLAGAPTFRAVVGRAARAARAAFDHSALPFRHLVRALNPDRDPGRVPLCDAMLAFRDEQEAELRLAGVDARRYEVDAGLAAADLTLTVQRAAPSVAGSLAYRSDLFERASAAVILDQLHTLLVAGLTTPDTPVDELPMDSAHRVSATAGHLDQIAAAVPHQPVHELVRRCAQHTPAADAIISSGGALTYDELDRKAARVTGGLRALGIDGSTVAVRMQPGPNQVAASLGVLRAGGHLAWLSTGDTGERGRAVLAELRPACLLLEGDPAADELASWYRDELGGEVVDVTVPDRLGRGETVSPSDNRVELDQPAYVAYTSGSTGKPKGIIQSHGAFAQFVTWMATALQIRPGSRVAQWVAPEHDPSLCEVFATLVAGGTLYPVPQRIRVHPEKFVDWLVGERITFLQTVPSFARELVKVITGRGVAGRLGSLERLVLMGETLPGELANGLLTALPTVRLTNMYGPTETIAATWCEITGAVPGTVPIGRPIPGRHVLVLDDADRPCPTGVTGELVIRSPYVARGYVGDDASRGAFRPVAGLAGTGPEPVRCYRTGDLARRRWDGLLEFRGRRDLQVKLHGMRVELAEVEAALAEHDTVAECAVVPLRDQDGLVIQLVAYVVPRHARSGGSAAGATMWRAHLRRRFGTSMRLVSFETLSGGLPRNAAGKVDRRRLPAPRAGHADTTRMPRPSCNTVTDMSALMVSAVCATARPHDPVRQP